MENKFRIEEVDHQVLAVAKRIHEVQRLAYAQEAALLGAVYFPPLERTVDELQESTERFVAAMQRDEMLACISVLSGDGHRGMRIASLVVRPASQRRGIGRALLGSVVEAHGHVGLTVQTGVKNIPPLTLYRHAGFEEVRRWMVGREPLELVELHRSMPR